jgi:hypothetical protein
MLVLNTSLIRRTSNELYCFGGMLIHKKELSNLYFEGVSRAGGFYLKDFPTLLPIHLSIFPGTIN